MDKESNSFATNSNFLLKLTSKAYKVKAASCSKPLFFSVQIVLPLTPSRLCADALSYSVRIRGFLSSSKTNINYSILYCRVFAKSMFPSIWTKKVKRRVCINTIWKKYMARRFLKLLGSTPFRNCAAR